MSKLKWGYSSLGLPLFDHFQEAQVDSILDDVLGDDLFQVLELHLESPAENPKLGQPLISKKTWKEIQLIAEKVHARKGTLLFGLGARYLLGKPKHEPSMIHPTSEGRALRLQLLQEALALASDVGSAALIFLAGPSVFSIDPPHLKYATSEWHWFKQGMAELLEQAERKNVILAPEAHSAHIFSKLEDLTELKRTMDSKYLGFTADTVHQFLMEPVPIKQLYEKWADQITHVQLDNTGTGKYETGSLVSKAPLDEPGVINLADAVHGLKAGGYQGSLSVEFLRIDHPKVDPLKYCKRIGKWLKESFA